MEWFWIVVGLGVMAFFAAGCACCGCTIASDDFNRSDSASIGSDWTEDSGTWEIYSNYLRLTSASGVVTYNTAIIDDDIYIQHSCSQPLASPSSNNMSGTFRIYLKTDANNYVVGELSRVSGRQDAWVRVYQCIAGTETKISEVVTAFVNNVTALRLCVDQTEQVVVFQISPGSSTSVQAVARCSGTFGDTVTLEASGLVDYYRVDSFVVGRLSDVCENCEACCDAAPYPPEEVQVEVSGLTGDAANCTDCSLLDGTYTLTYQGRGFGSYASTPIEGCVWKVDIDSYCGAKTLAMYQPTVPGDVFFGFFDKAWGTNWTGYQRQRFRYTGAAVYVCSEAEIVSDTAVNEVVNSNALCRVTFVTGTFTATPL